MVSLRLSALVSDSSKPHLAKNLTTLSQKTHASCSINCFKKNKSEHWLNRALYTRYQKKKKVFFYLYSHVYLYHTILNKIMVEY